MRVILLLTTKQIAQILKYSEQGVRVLLKRLPFPLVRKGKRWYVDSSATNSFSLSIRLQHQNQTLQVIYTIRDIAEKIGKDKKTVLRLLSDNAFPLYGKHKKYLLLWDLRQFEKSLGNISVR